MQVKPLYLPLKGVQGSFDLRQFTTFKTLKHIERYGELPKKGWHGYHHKRLIADSDVTDHSKRLEAYVIQRIEWLLKKNPELTAQLDENDNPHWNTPAGAFKKQRCKLLAEVSNLVRKKCMRSRTPIEDCFYHINTAWLEMNRIAHKKQVTYRNADTVVHAQGKFIPLKSRFYGRLRTT
jgi:hypothetical protein